MENKLSELENYRLQPVDEFLNDARLILESGNETNIKALTGSIFCFSRVLRKSQKIEMSKENSKTHHTEQTEKRHNIKKDTFVNLNILYQKLDKPLDDLGVNLFWVEEWLSKIENAESSEWLSEDVKHKIKQSVNETEKAMDCVSEIQEILLELKRSNKVKPSKDIQHNNLIRHLNVVNGGQYTPPQPKMLGDDPVLTQQGAAWLKEVRAKAERPDNV